MVRNEEINKRAIKGSVNLILNNLLQNGFNLSRKVIHE